jgi:NAD(P)-dependent dehydrogenase (short-subunit alcohol dehydrogenase family)
LNHKRECVEGAKLAGGKGPLCPPEEIGEAIVYLASDRSSFMTGHALVIDGAESL